MDEIKALAALVYAEARQHDDRYLLPRRYRKSTPPSDLDLLYDACQELVGSRHAVWDTGTKAPGIRLTGRPYP